MLKILIACLLLPCILSACTDPAKYEYSLKYGGYGDPNFEALTTKIECRDLTYYIPNCKYYAPV
jgi:hypothetical protein